MSTLRANQIQTITGEVILNSTGSILQTVFNENNTYTFNSAIRIYESIVSVTLTSVKANSRYFMTGYSHGYSSTSNSRGNLGFAVQSGASTTRLAGVDGEYGDSWGTLAYPGGQYNRSFVYYSSVAAGTNLTFYLLGAGYDSQIGWNFPGYGHKNCITVMEISA